MPPFHAKSVYFAQFRHLQKGKVEPVEVRRSDGQSESEIREMLAARDRQVVSLHVFMYQNRQVGYESPRAIVGGSQHASDALGRRSDETRLRILCHCRPHSRVLERIAKEILRGAGVDDPVLDEGLATEVLHPVDVELCRLSLLHDGSNAVVHERFREVNNPLTFCRDCQSTSRNVNLLPYASYTHILARGWRKLGLSGFLLVFCRIWCQCANFRAPYMSGVASTTTALHTAFCAIK